MSIYREELNDVLIAGFFFKRNLTKESFFPPIETNMSENMAQKIINVRV